MKYFLAYLGSSLKTTIVKIEKAQNFHLLHSNLILCHLCTVHIGKFISIAVHKEIIFFIHQGVLPGNFASVIVLQVLYFVSCFAFISIYSFNNFLHAKKKALSIQSTFHTSANCLILYTSPVSFVGLKTASFCCWYLFRNFKQVAKR